MAQTFSGTHTGHVRRVAPSQAPTDDTTTTSQQTSSYRRLGLSFKPGLMRSTIAFLVESGITQDTEGNLIPTDWVQKATTRAYARRTTGSDYYQMLQFGHKVDARFNMRWFNFNIDQSTVTTPTEAMRITWNNDTYRIIKVDDPDDLHIELQIDGLYISKQAEKI